jgi:hypothetical protein
MLQKPSMLRWIVNPFHSEQHRLWTRLSRAECAARLRARLAGDLSGSSTAARGTVEQYPIWGDVSDAGFTIVKRLPGYLVNRHIQASGRFISETDGNNIAVRLVEGRSSAYPELALLVLATVGLILSIGLDGFRSNPLAILGVFLWMAFVACALASYRSLGFWIARGEPEWLMRFLREALDAADIPPEGNQPPASRPG